jgi:hypothetical protein
MGPLALAVRGHLLLRRLGLTGQCRWPGPFELQTQMSAKIEQRDHGVVHTASPATSSVANAGGSSIDAVARERGDHLSQVDTRQSRF